MKMVKTQPTLAVHRVVLNVTRNGNHFLKAQGK